MRVLAGTFRADYSRWTPEQLFAVAADIENYPAFLPWCRTAKVLLRQEKILEVENHFGAGPIDAKFKTRAVMTPPEHLEIQSHDWPFRAMRVVWTFKPLGEGCQVSVAYWLDLRSMVLQTAARLALPEVISKVMTRFRNRAEALYGAAAP